MYLAKGMLPIANEHVGRFATRFTQRSELSILLQNRRITPRDPLGRIEGSKLNRNDAKHLEHLVSIPRMTNRRCQLNVPTAGRSLHESNAEDNSAPVTNGTIVLTPG
jgi:hypothetical protein